MDKSPDAFRTISEVADWLGVQTHVLRFWESKFTQVKPVKRAGGRRYYRPVDMLLLGGIRKLLHDDGLTIKGVQKVLKEQGVAHVSSLSNSLDDHSSQTLTEGAENVVRFHEADEDRPRAYPADPLPEAESDMSGEPEEITDEAAAPEEPAEPAPVPLRFRHRAALQTPDATAAPATPAAAPPDTPSPAQNDLFAAAAPPEPQIDTPEDAPPEPPADPAPAMRRPRVVQVTDPDAEMLASVPPGLLSRLARVPRQDPALRRALVPTVQRLSVLIDGMRAAHKE